MTKKENKIFRKLSSDIQKIKHHISTKEIKYPLYKQAYDYVDDLFPAVHIKDVKIYSCKQSVANDFGFQGIAGFYVPHIKTIIIVRRNIKKKKLEGSIEARVSADEIIVHELLHFVHSQLFSSETTAKEEDFAYGHSIKYLLAKGHDYKNIIDHNMLPYLLGLVDGDKILDKIIQDSGYTQSIFRELDNEEQEEVSNKLTKILFDKIIKIARQKGKAIIRKYK